VGAPIFAGEATYRVDGKSRHQSQRRRPLFRPRRSEPCHREALKGERALSKIRTSQRDNFPDGLWILFLPGFIMSGARPVLPLTGGCSCGAIRFRITLFPLLVDTCNCTNCQRASGSAFALNMPVLARDFHILQGEPKGWHHISPSGAQVTSRFRVECGGRLYGERAGRGRNRKSSRRHTRRHLVAAAVGAFFHA
jgi:hypothetical protein